jgi:hypothetical protein
MSRSVLEILDADNSIDRERWEALVARSQAFDVYYLPSYARATSEVEDSQAVAVVGGSQSSRFLAPLLLRTMSGSMNGSAITWTDALSPYGYGGLLPLAGCEGPDPDGLRSFLEDLLGWCSEQKVVCCVLRLHPLLQQEKWFAPEEQGSWRISLRGKTAAIGLESWDPRADRPSGMRHGRRLDLNAARRRLRITQAGGEDPDAQQQFGRFSALYTETMANHHAESFYKFPPSYFLALASLGHHCNMVFAWLDDRLAGASVFLAGHDYAHYHLACTNQTGMKYGAATLLVVEGAKWAKVRGCRLLHLGGGLSAGDPLEWFKCSFGGSLYRYAYLISVVDRERFNQISGIPNPPWPYRSSAD